MILIVIIIGVVLAAAMLFLVWKTARSRKLGRAATGRIRALIEKADRAGDPVLRILEYDKVLDALLLELHVHGSTGEKLMKAGPRFANRESLWKYHKLRNIVAHQSGAAASIADADGFRAAILQAFRQVSR